MIVCLPASPVDCSHEVRLSAVSVRFSYAEALQKLLTKGFEFSKLTIQSITLDLLVRPYPGQQIQFWHHSYWHPRIP